MVRLGFIPLGILSCIATRGGLARVHAHIPSHTCKLARGGARYRLGLRRSLIHTGAQRREFRFSPYAHMPNFVAPTTCPMLHLGSHTGTCPTGELFKPTHHYYGNATVFTAKRGRA